MADLESQPRSIQSLYVWYSENRLWVNRRYQRKLVWTLDEKQRLVESVMRRYPIPAILLAEKGDGDYEVIDGLQRLHTLISFIEMGFSTLDGDYFSVDDFTTASSRADDGAFVRLTDAPLLDRRTTGAFLDYSMAVSVMRGATSEEIDDVFSRINTYGHRLSDQERRQAGSQSEFSSMIRHLASQIRGDASGEELQLSAMPSISIDLPKTSHGYDVEARSTFWVREGVLRATDLRDSADEQCIADIAACIIGGSLIKREKDALDQIYERSHAEHSRIASALATYGREKFEAEFKFVMDEIELLVSASGVKLRDLLFKDRTTNPFHALFTVLFVALHEALVQGKKKFSSYEDAAEALKDLNATVGTDRGSTSVEKRRKNINVIKGLIVETLVEESHREIYGGSSTFDIDEGLRRSQVESAFYECKQGLVRLGEERT